MKKNKYVVVMLFVLYTTITAHHVRNDYNISEDALDSITEKLKIILKYSSEKIAERKAIEKSKPAMLAQAKSTNTNSLRQQVNVPESSVNESGQSKFGMVMRWLFSPIIGF